MAVIRSSSSQLLLSYQNINIRLYDSVETAPAVATGAGKALSATGHHKLLNTGKWFDQQLYLLRRKNSRPCILLFGALAGQHLARRGGK